VDLLERDLLAAAKERRLGIRGVRVWHYDTLRALLDSNEAVRVRYLGWLATGDLIASMATSMKDKGPELVQTLSNYVAKSLLDEAEANLTQAGSVSDRNPALHDLFIDLPSSTGRVDQCENDWTGVARGLISVTNLPRNAQLD